MQNSIKNEIQNIMHSLEYTFSIEDFEEKAKWYDVSCLPDLSEEFIEYYDRKGLISWLGVSKGAAVNFTPEFFEKN